MLAFLYAAVTVLAWGTWLAPSQNIPYRSQQIKTFYVAAANLLLASAVAAAQGFRGLTWEVFALPFAGGLVWSVSGFLAFTATHRLGMARAYGIWAPLNVVVSIFWGVVIFDEFLEVGRFTLALLGLALLINLAGVLLIIFAKGAGAVSASRAAFWSGVMAAVGTGILWGTYFIPIQLSEASMWVAAFPLSLGIFAGSLALAAATRQPLALNSQGEYLRTAATGLLWGVGNYGMLLLVDQIGAGRGFTVAQLGVVVSGLIGIYVLHDPQPRTRAAALTLTGCVFATLGGILLGSLK